MRPTDILMQEHRVIAQVLNCLEALTDRAVAEGMLEAVAAREILDFFRNFADGSHRIKEEKHLFPVLEAKCFSGAGTWIRVMLKEHDEGRQYLQTMAALVPGAAAGSSRVILQFVMQARAFVHFLRKHIYKEDHHLFPLADRVLTDQEQFLILDAFSAMENLHPGTRENFLQMAQRLAKQLQIARIVEDFGEVMSQGGAGHKAVVIPND